MLGVWDYTVVLTYLSAASAVMGICLSLQGDGHPYIGIFCLMICGLFDAFDGRVARSKKNRTDIEKNFGIQIDSLSDLLAFGVLPACIGKAVLRVSPVIPEVPYLKESGNRIESMLSIIIYIIIFLYVLAALIRLAYFNVMEEERQKTEKGCRKYYEGLPVTSSALLFPAILFLQYITRTDISYLYFIVMAATAAAFICRKQILKPGLRGILIMIGIGFLEFLLPALKWMVL